MCAAVNASISYFFPKRLLKKLMKGFMFLISRIEPAETVHLGVYSCLPPNGIEYVDDADCMDAKSLSLRLARLQCYEAYFLDVR